MPTLSNNFYQIPYSSSWWMCEICGKRKSDVTEYMDPYEMEAKGKKVYAELCKDCFTKLCEAVE